MQIGVGITTRNRSEILDITLAHFVEYTNMAINNYKFFIYSDNSTEEENNFYLDLKKAYPFINLEIGIERLGIAKAKNKCISNLKDVDHLFLFDDDCFPKALNWAEYYISTGIHHLMHLDPFVMDQNYKDAKIAQYNNCMGVMLYFTRHAIDLLGGYNKQFNIYGFEHAEISRRADLLGLTYPYKGFCSPVNSCDYIYSMDIDINHKGINPPLCGINSFKFVSSMQEGEDVQRYISENGIVYGNVITGKIEIE